MRAWITRHLPSPAMCVALLALFVALSGSAYAGVQLKKNSVTSKAIKDKSIQGKDVKSNTLTGKQINESSLGTVPHASVADSVAGAGGTSAKAVTDQTLVTFNVPMNRGDTAKALTTIGPFTITGACNINGATNFNLVATVSTSANSTWLQAGGTDNDFNPGDPGAMGSVTNAGPNFRQHVTWAAQMHDPASGLAATGSVDVFYGFPSANCRYSGSFIVTRP